MATQGRPPDSPAILTRWRVCRVCRDLRVAFLGVSSFAQTEPLCTLRKKVPTKKGSRGLTGLKLKNKNSKIVLFVKEQKQ